MGTVQTQLPRSAEGLPSHTGGGLGQVPPIQGPGPWGAGGDKAAGERYEADEILKLSSWRCRVPGRVCVFVAPKLQRVEVERTKWTGVNASRSEQWHRRDARDGTQPIEVDVKNGEE